MAAEKHNCDFLIIGGGMAGCSAGYFLADKGSVIVLEREDQPGYHSTGRSAAVYATSYGNAPIRAITRAGRAFYLDPPSGFSDTPLLTPRGTVFIGRADQADRIAARIDEVNDPDHFVEIDAADVYRRVPALRDGYVAAAAQEAAAMDIDVHAVHHGFIRGIRAKSGRLVTDAEVLGLDRREDVWYAETRAGSFSAPVVVNAAGAWGDELAALGGIRPIGLVPKRRTALTFHPGDWDVRQWPIIVDIAEEFYFKPETGLILCSPADETPMAPCDVQPDEIDIATAVDRVERATTLKVARIDHKWAGLRSFVEDKTPVVGFDEQVPGFFWLVGQGGYGIQTAPGMGQLVGELATGALPPDEMREVGVDDAALSPLRLR